MPAPELTRRSLLAGGLALAGAALAPARAARAAAADLDFASATPIDLAGRLADVIGGFRPPPGF